MKFIWKRIGLFLNGSKYCLNVSVSIEWRKIPNFHEKKKDVSKAVVSMKSFPYFLNTFKLKIWWTYLINLIAYCYVSNVILSFKKMTPINNDENIFKIVKIMSFICISSRNYIVDLIYFIVLLFIAKTIMKKDEKTQIQKRILRINSD